MKSHTSFLLIVAVGLIDIAAWSQYRLTSSFFLATLGLGLLASVLLWHWDLWRAIAPHPADGLRLPRYPSVTVVRPVRGRDVGAEDNFRAALDTGYPGVVETLFVFDDETDPGLPLARRVASEHRAAGRPGQVEVVVAGSPPPGHTGKLNAMMVGAARARGELIAFGDSDTRPDHDVLRGVVETLITHPDAGSAFAPVLVHLQAQKAGDALYALMQNALYSPLAAHAAGEERALPFIMGQLMVFQRRALDAIGGVGVAQGQFVDDMYIGKRLHQAGFRNLMSRHPLHIATGGMSLRQFLPVYRRWMMFSRNGLPFSFTWQQWLTGLRFGAALLVGLVALGLRQPLAALPALVALWAVGWSQLALQHRYSGVPIPARLSWTAWGVFLLSPWVLLVNGLRRDVDWRGRVYHLDATAALADARPTAGLLSGPALSTAAR